MKAFGSISIFFPLPALLALVLAACATSPLGRKQLVLLPDSQMDSMGAQAFSEMKQKEPVDSRPNTHAYVQCVVTPILEASRSQLGGIRWELVVFRDPTANAFALPGGKIGVNTGLLPVAKTDAQLAAVLGHEIGHVIAKHGNERMSEALAQGVVLNAANALLNRNGQDHPYAMAALGLGAQVGIALPHSRTQESEADLIGLKLMAEAGYDPHESVELWKNMMKASGGSPPEFLSTHPASTSRIQNLQAHLPEVMPLYERAGQARRHPTCNR